MNETLKDVIDSYNEYIVRIIPGIDSIIEKLKGNPVNSGMSDIFNLIEGTTWLIEVNKYLEVETKLITVNVQLLNNVNSELITVLESQDSYLLIDFLEYEYKEIIKGLKKIKLTEEN